MTVEEQVSKKSKKSSKNRDVFFLRKKKVEKFLFAGEIFCLIFFFIQTSFCVKDLMFFSVTTFLLLVLSVTFGGCEVSESERQALVDLYLATNGDDWKKNENWLSGDPCDSHWYGISTPLNPCTTSVRALSLEYNSLEGTLPSSLGNLSQLQTIHLYDNTLNGTLPSSLGDLSRLQEMSMFENGITGSLPDSLGKLSLLNSLYLYSNEMSGTIPDSFSNFQNQLIFFYLYNNSFTGNVPDWICHSKFLVTDLTDNYFFCPLPSCCAFGTGDGSCEPCCCEACGGGGGGSLSSDNTEICPLESIRSTIADALGLTPPSPQCCVYQQTNSGDRKCFFMNKLGDCPPVRDHVNLDRVTVQRQKDCDSLCK